MKIFLGQKQNNSNLGFKVEVNNYLLENPKSTIKAYEKVIGRKLVKSERADFREVKNNVLDGLPKKYSIIKDNLTQEQLVNELHNARLVKGIDWINTKADIDYVIKGIFPTKPVYRKDGTPKRRSNFLIFIDEDLTIYRVIRHEHKDEPLFSLRGNKYSDILDNIRKNSQLLIINKYGYSLNNSGYLLKTVRKTTTFHKIVAYTFDDIVKKPKDFGKKEYHIDHIDGDKLNNHPQNLRWVTRSENMKSYHRNRIAQGKSLKGIPHKNFGRYYYDKEVLHLDGEKIPMKLEQYIQYRKDNGLTLKNIRRSGYAL
jgi:hypothetical protein